MKDIEGSIGLTAEEVLAKKAGLVSTVKEGMTDVINALSPTTIRKLGAKAVGAKMTTGMFNTIVSSIQTATREA